jgi:hypothetical protein
MARGEMSTPWMCSGMGVVEWRVCRRRRAMQPVPVQRSRMVRGEVEGWWCWARMLARWRV